MTASTSKPHITISVGVASMSPAREADPIDPGATTLVKAADRALYAAKADGRDQMTEYLPQLEDVQRIADLGMDELPFGPTPKSDGDPT